MKTEKKTQWAKNKENNNNNNNWVVIKWPLARKTYSIEKDSSQFHSEMTTTKLHKHKHTHKDNIKPKMLKKVNENNKTLY